MQNQMHWSLWAVLVLCVSLWLGIKLTGSGDKQLFMPGPLTQGHHQIGVACNACHAQAESPADESEAMQQACLDCHGEVRVKPHDSHSRSKFTDPRNADLLQNIDVLACVTCHVEHKPEITHTPGFTQPGDFCFHCHVDIAKDRPTHEGLGFETCLNAGCHNYHNNRALYTDFLIKHLDDTDVAEKPRVPAKEFAQILDQLMEYPHGRFPVRALSAAQADAPGSETSDSMRDDWLSTAHARSGVNCTACHQTNPEQPWQESVDHKVCQTCHASETQGFLSGLHGMRLKQSLPPMKVSHARRSMKQDSQDLELTCTSCHAAHRFDVTQAAVEACLTCHDDEHTLAYKDSIHHELWQKELSGELEPGAGVSCATCHMPRVDHDASDWLSRILVQHNQSATLQPNEKMIRPTCLHCHGLGFSIDSLADPKLIENNFQGKPAVHVKSMEMADLVNKKSQEETGGELF